MTHTRASQRGQRGAVAVVAALCSVLLFSIAALAVDLGNTMVRKRDAQSQADFAALAGGAALELSSSRVASDPTVIAVANYLQQNHPQDDRPGPLPTVLPLDLVDGNPANGNIEFLSGGRMRVTSPVARVNFGFAGILGLTNTSVAAQATIGLRSPGPAVPFFLPQSCASGQIDIKATSYNPSAPPFDPASSHGGSIAQLDSLNDLTVAGGVTSTLTLKGRRFASTMSADFFHEQSGDRVPTDTTLSLPVTTVSYTGTDDEATVDLPARVFNTPGRWYLRVNNGFGYSSDAVSFLVGDPTPPPAGCGVKATGDFGVIDSPRAGVTQLADASALNMAQGLDHDLALFPAPYPPRGTDSCQGYGPTPVAGAVPDKNPVDGNNCVDVKNGMNTDVTTAGMVTGGTTSTGEAYDGRLEAPTSTGCDRHGGSAEAYRLGHYINDDVLSCFLPTGVTVGHVSGTSVDAAHEHVVSSRIFDSPRFMVVPVIDADINPPNGFYPLIKYVPVFITDETDASEKGNSEATSINGVIDNGSKVLGLTVVVLHPDAMPLTAAASGPTVPWTGSGTKVIQLVD